MDVHDLKFELEPKRLLRPLFLLWKQASSAGSLLPVTKHGSTVLESLGGLEKREKGSFQGSKRTKDDDG